MDLNTIVCADFFDMLSTLEPASVDMFLCDLPYGTTACSWDEIIPFEPMWVAIKRVIKPRAAVVLTASQPFTSALVTSNIKLFRYSWIWDKSNGGGFLNANRQPLKRHEDILIFYDGLGTYNPQRVPGKPYRIRRADAGGTTRDKSVAGWITINGGDRYPTSILDIPSETGYHPTQKPVALFEYLIRTYTRPGELVVDPCIGSGTTALAARNTGRNYICGDSSPEYVAIAQQRLAMPYTLPLFTETQTEPKATQTALFETDIYG